MLRAGFCLDVLTANWGARTIVLRPRVPSFAMGLRVSGSVRSPLYVVEDCGAKFCAVQFFGEALAMLVLSRKKNESIIIDGSIVITVVDIRGDKVRLGIEAPKEIPIHRSEIHASIQSEQAAGKEPPPKVTPAEA